MHTWPGAREVRDGRVYIDSPTFFVLERCCFEMGRKWSYTHGGIDRLPGCKLRREKDRVWILTRVICVILSMRKNKYLAC